MKLSKCPGCMEDFSHYPCPNCGYDPSNAKNTEYALSPETILAGKYLVGKVLGQGGFGITYIGWDIALERKVAIKEYYPSGHVSRSPGTLQLTWYSSEPSQAARQDGMQIFLKEARKMVKVENIPGVVRVLDLFQENGTAYIIMEYVQGTTLKTYLQKNGPIPWEQAKQIFYPVISAMEQVHQAGLVHRDLSPDNLMLTPNGDVKILDLGAAKDLNLNSGASSMQVAKSGFSPLEQYVHRGSSGPWTDVYAMAATIYYAITGTLPPNAVDRLACDTLSWAEPKLKLLPAAVRDALQKALPYIQAGLDYVSQNGETVVKVLAGLAGGFAVMSAAPLLNSLGGGAVSAAGLGAKGVSWLMSKGQAAGGGLMNGLGTLGGMIQTSNMYGQMTGQSTTGVLAKALWSSLKGSNLGKEVGRNLGNAKGWAGSIFGNVKGFAGAQWQASQGLASGIMTLVGGQGKLAAGNPLAAAGGQILGGLGGMLSNGAGALGTFWAPFAGMFGSILSSALPLVGVMGAIAAAVSLLGDNLDNVRTAIGNVFGDTGVAVFDGFLGKITAVKDAVLGVFSPENLANARQAIVGLFGENAGTGFDNLISIGQAVVGVFKQIGDFGVQVVKPIFEQIWGFISGTFLPGMLTLFNAVAPIVSQLISSVGSAVVGVATLIGQAIQVALPIVEGIITAIMGIVTVAAPAVLGGISAIADGIADVVGAVQGVFDGLITFVTGVFTMNWGQAWEGVKEIFGSAFDGLVELCKTPINAVIGIINGAISGINSIFGNGVTIPDWVPKVGGKSFSMNLKTIPTLATGGFTDGVSIAGEAGTEAVISFDPAYRASNLANWQKAGRMLGVEAKEVNTSGGRSGGSVSVSFAPNITIQGNADRDTVAQAMAEAKEQFAAWLEEYMRKQQRTAYATR